MNSERWAQIEELFHRAIECDASRRDVLLDQACNGDLELRSEVEALLSSDSAARSRVEAAIDSEIHDFGFSLVGEVVTHYRILAALGGGGMGQVYLAEDLKLGRHVALKFLPEESAQDPAALARFEREARSASALEHPNICPLYEFGEHEGRPFLVMQLLEGRTLRELLEGTKADGLPLAEVLDLAIQIATGLEAAHQKGIIHRDIKPANIFVTDRGQAEILDFGLAKLTGGTNAEGDDRGGPNGNTIRPGEQNWAKISPDPLLSQAGLAMGTAGYMSPEQIRGEKLDARTDIFSFGLVLYEMATGHRAFEGDTGPALHDAILTKSPVPARQLTPQIPAKLGQTISKALEKNRDDRYQTFSEMRADLEILKRKMATRNPRHWFVTIAAPIFALIVMGAFFWFEKRQTTSNQAPPEIKFRQLTVNSSENPVTAGSISPNGKYLVYLDNRGMHVKDIETSTTHSVPQPEATSNNAAVTWELGSTAWLADSTRFLATAHPAEEAPENWSSRTASIWMFSRVGEAPHKLRDHAVFWSVSPDGSQVAFGTNKGKLGEREIWLMRPEGEQAGKLFETDENSSIVGLLWSPDGQRGLYIRSDASGDTLLSRDLHGGPPVTVLTPAEAQRTRGDPSWLPDGRLIYQVGEAASGYSSPQDTCNFWTRRLDVHTGLPLEKQKRLTNWTSFCVSSANVTADGKRFAFLQSSNGHDTAYVADLEAGGTRIRNPRHFTLEEASDDIMDWTADSKTVILSHNRGDHYELYKQLVSSDTAEPLVPSEAGGWLEQAQVSPNGKWVIAQVYPIPGGPPQPNRIIRVPLSGGTPDVIFTVREGSAVWCARAPSNLCGVAEQSENGKEMIITTFDVIQGRGRELGRVEIDPDYDTRVNNLLWNISPDGTRLALAPGPAGPIEIRSLRGHPTKVIRAKNLDHLHLLVWAADGNGLFVSKVGKGGNEVLHLDLQGNTHLIWKSIGWPTFASPSQDGRHLAINAFQQSANMWMMENF